MTGITIHVDGPVRIVYWEGRKQPYTIWRGDQVWHFASTKDAAIRLADNTRRSRAA